MRAPIVTGTVLLLGLLSALPMAAQSPASEPSTDSSDLPTARLRHGAVVRLTTEPDRRQQGVFRGVDTSNFFLEPRIGPEQRIPLAEIDTLWVRGNAVRQGALAGGTVGTLSVMGFLFLLINGLCDAADGCSDDYPQAVLYGVGIGGGGGALLGALIGAAIPTWRRHYP